MTQVPRPDDRLDREPENDADVRQGIPAGDWSRDELYGRADHENKLIGRHENCAAHYWYLGKALSLVRQDADHGHWQRWCVLHEIDRSRWIRASLLARAFESPDDFGDMTLEAASALAREILGIEPRQPPIEARHRRRLRTIAETLQTSLDELAGPDAAKIRAGDESLVAVDRAARLLRELRSAYTSLRRSRDHKSRLLA